MRIRFGRKKKVLAEAERISALLRGKWPVITTEISLEPQERGDAYIWIGAPASLEDEIAGDAAELTTDAYDEKGIEIVARLEPTPG